MPRRRLSVDKERSAPSRNSPNSFRTRAVSVPSSGHAMPRKIDLMGHVRTRLQTPAQSSVGQIELVHMLQDGMRDREIHRLRP